mgnify:FL=1
MCIRDRVKLGAIIISINEDKASWENLTEALQNSFPGDQIALQILQNNIIIEKKLITKAQIN